MTKERVMVAVRHAIKCRPDLKYSIYKTCNGQWMYTCATKVEVDHIYKNPITEWETINP